MVHESEKTPAKSPAAVMMEPQVHGGVLRRGGTNRGGPGRPRDKVRALALHGAARAVPRLIAIAMDPTSEPRDVIAAARTLLEFGVGRQIEVEGELQHEHLFVVEVPPREATPEQWAARYGTRLKAGSS